MSAAFKDYYSELMPYTVLANSWWISVYDAYQSKATPINDNDYSCHIQAIELV